MTESAPETAETPAEDSMNPGIYYGQSDQEYRAGNALSSTLLRRFLQAPALAKATKDGLIPKKEISDTFQTGILCHAMVLEPDTVESRFAVMPEGMKRTTKEGRAMYSTLSDEVGADNVLRAHQVVIAEGVKRSVENHPRASRYFAMGDAEVSIFVKDPETGLLLCCRCDWLCRYPSVVVDLKTCLHADLDNFGRESIRFGYHFQAVHYLQVCRFAGIPVEDFVFVAVEKEPPYLCQVFRCSDLLQEWATDNWRNAVNDYAYCVENDVWPGYGVDIASIELPRYMM